LTKIWSPTCSVFSRLVRFANTASGTQIRVVTALPPIEVSTL